MARQKTSRKIKIYNPLSPKREIFTKEQAEEFTKCAQDFEYFTRKYVKIQTTDDGSELFNLRPYQSHISKIIQENRFSIFVAGRQTGKSQLISSLLLWYAIFHAEMRIGIASNKLKSAKEIIKRIKFSYEEMPFWLKPAVKEYNKESIEFDNNSVIEAGATTSDGLRSKTYNIIFLDEFAHVKPNIAEEFWTSTFPVVSSGTSTKVVITSTPNGMEGTFADIWFGAVNGDNGFAHYKVNREDIPGRDEKFKQMMLKKMTLTKYLQEFEGHFLSSKGTLISSMFLESVLRKPAVETFKDHTNFFLNPAGRRLIIGCDTGTGIGEDYHTFEIFDLDTLEQVGEFRNNIYNQSQLVREFIQLLDWLDKEKQVTEIKYSFESNAVGLGVISLIENSNHPIFNRSYIEMIHQFGANLPGMTMSQKTKKSACAKFKDLLENRHIKIYSERLISELRFFVKTGESFKAESGRHDDLVMACLIMTNMLEELAGEDESINRTMHQVDVLEDGSNDPMPIVL